MRKVALIFSLVSACQHPPETPLVLAARNGDVRTVRDLVARGADPNEYAGVNSWTPLEHAVHKGQIGSVAALLDAGANPNRADPQGTTPLMMAAGYGYTDIVQLLLRRGADARLRDHDGATALDLAVTGVADIDRFTLFDCQNETVKLLRGAGAPSGTTSTVARLKRC
jgi:ankyrin repeat protein